LLLFLARQVSSERSFPRKASSEGRTFVTNPYLVRKDNGKVGNLAFAPGKAQGEKPNLCETQILEKEASLLFLTLLFQS